MDSQETDYKLGDEVSASANKGRTKGSNVVLSVRLSGEEVARIEAVAEAEGKTLSQVVRAAVRTYASGSPRRLRGNQSYVTISTSDFTWSIGTQPQSSQPTASSDTRQLVPLRD